MPVLLAKATAIEVNAAVDDGADVPAWPGLEHILIDADGLQHVVLRAHGVVLQLVIEGADLTSGPVGITFFSEGRHTVRRSGEQMIMLDRVLSGRGPTPPALSRCTSTTLRLRNVIIALDGHAVGATHREVATVIHGQEKIDREWEAGFLKDQVRRSLRRGLELSRGGYRDLLRQGW